MSSWQRCVNIFNPDITLQCLMYWLGIFLPSTFVNNVSDFTNSDSLSQACGDDEGIFHVMRKYMKVKLALTFI